MRAGGRHLKSASNTSPHRGIDAWIVSGDMLTASNVVGPGRSEGSLGGTFGLAGT